MRKVRIFWPSRCAPHNFGTSQQLRRVVKSSLNMVGLRPHLINHYPHQFSGAAPTHRCTCARQQSGIHCLRWALFLPWMSRSRPSVISFETLQEQLQLTYLFITHDLSVVRQFADRVGVMFLGVWLKWVRRKKSSTIRSTPYAPVPDFRRARADPHQRSRAARFLKVKYPMNLPRAAVSTALDAPAHGIFCRTDEPEYFFPGMSVCINTAAIFQASSLAEVPAGLTSFKTGRFCTARRSFTGHLKT